MFNWDEYADSMKAIIILFTFQICIQMVFHVIKFLRYRASVSLTLISNDDIGSSQYAQKC